MQPLAVSSRISLLPPGQMTHRRTGQMDKMIGRKRDRGRGIQPCLQRKRDQGKVGRMSG